MRPHARLHAQGETSSDNVWDALAGSQEAVASWREYGLGERLDLAGAGRAGITQGPLPFLSYADSAQACKVNPLVSAEVDPPAEEAPEEQTPSRKGFRQRLRGISGWAIYIGIIALVIVFTPRILSCALDTQYRMAAVSSSMWPTLKKGDLVFLEEVDKPEHLEVGDVIGFEPGDGGFAIRRVIDIEGDHITTNGDANGEPDPAMSFDRVIGRMPKIGGRLVKVPYLGNLGILLRPLFGVRPATTGRYRNLSPRGSNRKNRSRLLSARRIASTGGW